jgi:hypothetical protein
VRETFASHGSSAYGLLSSAPQQLNLTIVAAWLVYPWSWRNVSGLQYAQERLS